MGLIQFKNGVHQAGIRLDQVDLRMTGPVHRTGKQELGDDSSPIHARFFLNSVAEIAKQTADDIPPIGAAQFDVPLFVDADDAVIIHTGTS